MKMLKRILVAVLLIALLFSVLIFGGWYQCAVISIAALLSVYELRHALTRNERGVFSLPAFIFAAVFYLVYNIDGLTPVFLVWLACVMSVCAERVLNPKRNTQEALFGLALMIYPVVFYVVIMLLAEDPHGFNRSRVAMLSAFAMPLMGDTVAYFIGRLFGKKKLCPDISPNKTVAGGVGGIIGGALGGALVYFLQYFYPAGEALLPLMMLGFLCGVLGQFGDLFASAIKRYAGVKDYGNIFPGHGGMTDRLDSVLFCAPLVYAVFMLWPR